jgi:hypothetical protein
MPAARTGPRQLRWLVRTFAVWRPGASRPRSHGCRTVHCLLVLVTPVDSPYSGGNHLLDGHMVSIPAPGSTTKPRLKPSSHDAGMPRKLPGSQRLNPRRPSHQRGVARDDVQGEARVAYHPVSAQIADRVRRTGAVRATAVPELVPRCVVAALGLAFSRHVSRLTETATRVAAIRLCFTSNYTRDGWKTKVPGIRLHDQTLV